MFELLVSEGENRYFIEELQFLRVDNRYKNREVFLDFSVG